MLVEDIVVMHALNHVQPILVIGNENAAGLQQQLDPAHDPRQVRYVRETPRGRNRIHRAVLFQDARRSFLVEEGMPRGDAFPIGDLDRQSGGIDAEEFDAEGQIAFEQRAVIRPYIDGKRFAVQTQQLRSLASQSLQVPRGSLCRSTDEREVFIHDCRVNRIAQLTESAIQAMK